MRRQRKVAINVGIPTAVAVVLAVVAVLMVIFGRGEPGATSKAMDQQPELSQQEASRSLQETNTISREEPKENPKEAQFVELKLVPIEDQEVKVGDRLEVAIKANGEINANEIQYTIKKGPSGLPKDAIRSGTLIWQPTQSDVGRHEVLVLAETTSDQPRKSELQLRIDVVAAKLESGQDVPSQITDTEISKYSPEPIQDTSSAVNTITLDLSGQKPFYEFRDQSKFENVPRSELMLEISDLTLFHKDASFRGPRRRGFGEAVKIALSEPRGAAVSVKLARNGARRFGLSVQARVKTGNKDVGLTKAELQEMRSQLENVGIPKMQGRKKQLVQQKTEFEKGLDLVRRNWPESTYRQRHAKFVEVRRLLEEIEKVNKALRANKRHTEFLQRRLASLPRLERLVSELHQKAQIPFRILAQGRNDATTILIGGIHRRGIGNTLNVAASDHLTTLVRGLPAADQTTGET